MVVTGPELSRRGLLAGAVAAPVMAAASSSAASGQTATDPVVAVRLTINGELRQAQVDARTTLLDLLRDHLRLTGTKKGCDHGQCGACTVLSNGHRINACLTLAAMQSGREITTIEGLGEPGRLHALQRAVVAHDGFQCGYCTPGQICSTLGALEEVERGVPSHVSADLAVAPEPTRAELRERLSGNICRCGAYANIHDAIAQYLGAKA